MEKIKKYIEDNLEEATKRYTYYTKRIEDRKRELLVKSKSKFENEDERRRTLHIIENDIYYLTYERDLNQDKMMKFQEMYNELEVCG